jgi:hypothetical protein
MTTRIAIILVALTILAFTVILAARALGGVLS